MNQAQRCSNITISMVNQSIGEAYNPQNLPKPLIKDNSHDQSSEDNKTSENIIRDDNDDFKKQYIKADEELANINNSTE